MSEYWVSTPKIFCKYCKAFVRDTPLERRNHDATPRHQGNLKRSLRDLHRANERGERDAQRAKDEVARLNGLAGSSSGPPGSASTTSRQPGAGSSDKGAVAAPIQQATAEERRKQMAQLAAMGVAVPEGFRRENAMAGSWEVLGQRVLERPAEQPNIKTEDGKEEGDDSKGGIAWQSVGAGGNGESKPAAASLNTGVRKRRPDAAEEAEAEEEALRARAAPTAASASTTARKRRRWGTDVRQLPGAGEDDLDALLGATSAVRGKRKLEAAAEAEAEADARAEAGFGINTGMAGVAGVDGERQTGGQAASRSEVEGRARPSDAAPGDADGDAEDAARPTVKREDSAGDKTVPEGGAFLSDVPAAPQEDDGAPDPGLMFKKRKPKGIRQRT